jgi:DNA-binding HxlR family transcriptional regulator
MTVGDQLNTSLRLLASDTFDSECPTRPIMDKVTSRWGTLIVAALVTEPHRFSALHRRIGGISQKMLSQHLKALVSSGLVIRNVEPTVPPQVTYSLTELGTSLAGPLTDLLGWFGRNRAELLAAQQQTAD